MKILNKPTALILMVLGTLSLSACSDGEAEKAGEKIDQVIKDTGNAIEDACEKVKEGVKAENKNC